MHTKKVGGPKLRWEDDVIQISSAPKLTSLGLLKKQFPLTMMSHFVPVPYFEHSTIFIDFIPTAQS